MEEAVLSGSCKFRFELRKWTVDLVNVTYPESILVLDRGELGLRRGTESLASEILAGPSIASRG